MRKRWINMLLAVLVCAGGFFAAPSAAYADDGETAAEETKEEKFVVIYRDSSYTYYLDKENMKRREIPFQKKQMLDVWIKLVPTRELLSNSDGTVESSGTYYLEHYLIRKDKKQIQFLCELEVNGRPNNDINAGKYDPMKWEELVPESIEDRIYHGVVQYAPDNADPGDVLEDVFRVSI